jgi:hypothetical protein
MDAREPLKRNRLAIYVSVKKKCRHRQQIPNRKLDHAAWWVATVMLKNM